MIDLMPIMEPIIIDDVSLSLWREYSQEPNDVLASLIFVLRNRANLQHTDLETACKTSGLFRSWNTDHHKYQSIPLEDDFVYRRIYMLVHGAIAAYTNIIGPSTVWFDTKSEYVNLFELNKDRYQLVTIFKKFRFYYEIGWSGI